MQATAKAESSPESNACGCDRGKTPPRRVRQATPDSPWRHATQHPPSHRERDGIEVGGSELARFDLIGNGAKGECSSALRGAFAGTPGDEDPRRLRDLGDPSPSSSCSNSVPRCLGQERMAHLPVAIRVTLATGRRSS
jgi:hypothetical protein